MKTLKRNISLTAMMLIMATGFGFATNPDAVRKENSYREVRNQVEKKLSFPEFAKATEDRQSVFVSFYVEHDGTLKVLGTKGENEQLKKYVEEKLDGQKIKADTGTVNKTFNLELKFRLL